MKLHCYQIAYWPSWGKVPCYWLSIALCSWKHTFGSSSNQLSLASLEPMLMRTGIVNLPTTLAFSFILPFCQNLVVDDKIWLKLTGLDILYTWLSSASSMIDGPWKKLSSTHFFLHFMPTPIYNSIPENNFSQLSKLFSIPWKTWFIHHCPWAYTYSNLRSLCLHVDMHFSKLSPLGRIFLTSVFQAFPWFLAGISSQLILWHKLSLSLLHQLFITNSPCTIGAC